MKFDKWTIILIFGLLGFVSLILMWKINIDYAGGPFAILAIIFTLVVIISIFYRKNKQ